MYDLGYMLAMNQDPLWYSMDYRVYMGSSMTVGSFRWLPLYLCSYKLVGSVTATIELSGTCYHSGVLTYLGLGIRAADVGHWTNLMAFGPL